MERYGRCPSLLTTQCPRVGRLEDNATRTQKAVKDIYILHKTAPQDQMAERLRRQTRIFQLLICFCFRAQVQVLLWSKLFFLRESASTRSSLTVKHTCLKCLSRRRQLSPT